ncbi:MAG: hypothetical protein GC161_02225 [Planctomycetaceae bacterium]|nr:hypothetical protein [Planctomycetaceae bacterium]
MKYGSRILCAMGAGAALVGCRAFERPIAEREGRLRVDAHSVPLSMADDHADLFGSAYEAAEPRMHLDALPPPVPPAQLPGDETISMELAGAELSEVLAELAQRAGVHLVQEDVPRTVVHATLTEQSVRDAFQWLAERHGLHLELVVPGSYRVRPDSATDLTRATFRLRSTKVEAVGASVEALADEGTRVVLDAAAGLVLVHGTRSNVLEIAAYLDEVDRRQPQILVEARILEVTLGENFGLGVTGIVDGSIEGGTLGLLQNLAITDDSSFALTLGTRDGSVEGTILAISKYVGTDLVSSPRVLALSGTEALIEVVREVPYVQVTTTTTGTTGGLGSQTLEEVEFKEAGVRLRVTPILEDGGYVRMRVDQEFSEVTERFQDIPIIDKRTIGVDFLVRNRDTVVLGGLMQDRRTEVDSGVPGLARLPLIGRLFRSDEDERQKRELIVFLTPRVVDDPESRRIVEAMRQAYADAVNRTGVRSTQEAQVSPW